MEPEFLHSVGIAVATFACLEAFLTIAFFVTKHQSQDFSSYPETALEIYEANFSSKIDKLFAKLSSRIKNPVFQQFIDLNEEFYKERHAQNFIVHGICLLGDKEVSYLCKMIDNAGRTIRNEVDQDVVIGEAIRAENLMIKLKSLLMGEKLYSALGSRKNMGSESIY